nr:hypothetical protein [Polymorphobacter sp.]
MPRIVHLTVEYLPENVYLGYSEDVQGLVVQADTIGDLLEYADDIARILIEDETGAVPGPDDVVIHYHEVPYVAAA